MSLLKLYELTDSYKAIADIIEEMPDESLETALQQIEGAIEEKAGNIGKLIKILDYDAEIIKAEEKRLAERRKALENKRERIKAYIQGQMERVGKDKIKLATITLTIQNNPPAVQIVDEELIPAGFITIVQQTNINRKEIAEVLKAGKEVPGATLTQGKSLRIR